MKKTMFNLIAFGFAYTMFNDNGVKTITNNEDGATVEPNEKGEVVLIADIDIEFPAEGKKKAYTLKAGSPYTITVENLASWIEDGQWVEVPESAVDAEKEAMQTRIKELRKQMKTKQGEIADCEDMGDAFMKLKAEYAVIKTELEALEAKSTVKVGRVAKNKPVIEYTEEEKVKIGNYESAIENVKQIKDSLKKANEIVEALKATLPETYKVKGNAGTSEGVRVTDAIRLEIYEMRKTMKPAEIAKTHKYSTQYISLVAKQGKALFEKMEAAKLEASKA